MGDGVSAEDRRAPDGDSESLLSYDPSVRARRLLADLREAFEQAEREADLYGFGAAYALLSAAVRPLVAE